MNLHNKKINNRQRKAIIAIMGSPSVTQAAKLADIPERTIREWLTLDAFRDALGEAQSETFQEAARALVALQSGAIETLDVERQNGESSGTRIRSAALILEYGAKYTELAVLEKRITELERNINHDN
jgi:hypothetical protein